MAKQQQIQAAKQRELQKLRELKKIEKQRLQEAELLQKKDTEKKIRKDKADLERNKMRQDLLVKRQSQQHKKDQIKVEIYQAGLNMDPMVDTITRDRVKSRSGSRSRSTSNPNQARGRRGSSKGSDGIYKQRSDG